MSITDYNYVERTVENIHSSLGILGTPQPMEPGPLLSIHMQSNRPDNFSRFLDELEASLDDPTRIEVVVKIDDTDIAMNELLAREVTRRKVTVKYISTPLVGGFFALWSSMNDMLKVCHPHAYFLWNMNDEMAVVNKGWDTMLMKYVGLFPDHIFRLRTSLFRFRNYYDYWECGFSPETSAITTKRWIDICGDWNPCLGPDSFNQLVSFYFGYHDRFNKFKVLRDVPIHDLLLAGEGAFIGLEGDKLWRRMRGATKAWYILMSHKTQTEASRRSQKLLAHIWAYDNGHVDFTVEDNHLFQYIVVRDGTEKPLKRLHYGLSGIRIWCTNIHRATYYYYYGGGGVASLGARFRQISAFLAMRFDSLEWLHTRYKQLAEKRSEMQKAFIKRFVYLFWYHPDEAYASKSARTLAQTCRNTVLTLESMARRGIRIIAMRGFNRGMRFHESVFSFDAAQKTLDWQDMYLLLGKVKWPLQMSLRTTQMTLCKCLMLQHWYGLSDIDLVTAIGRDLAFQRFVGIPFGAPQPPLALIQNFRAALRDAAVEAALYDKADGFIATLEGLPEKPLVKAA